jgi:hypothetical protein
MQWPSRRQGRESFVIAPSHARPNHFIFAKQHFSYFYTAPRHARGMFELGINRRWGLISAKAWACLLIDRIYFEVLRFEDETELGAQARQRQFYCSCYVRNGHNNEHCSNGRN